MQTIQLMKHSLSTQRISTTPPEDHVIGWTHARNYDDFIQFQGENKVEKLNVRRVEREVGRNIPCSPARGTWYTGQAGDSLGEARGQMRKFSE